MPPKRDAAGSAGSADGAPPTKRFRTSMLDKFLSSKLSGKETRELLEDAHAAGAKHIGDLAKVGRSGARPGNICRDLLRKACRPHRKFWPPFYWAPVTLYDSKKQEEISVNIPFLLPHLVLHYWIKERPALLPRLRPTSDLQLQALRDTARMMKCAPEDIVVFGLHGDGVPFNRQRTQTLEVLSMNWPAFVESGKKTRVPITGLPRHWVAQDKTWDELLSIIAWSFRMLALGTHPTRRHDGKAFKERHIMSKLAGQKMISRGALLEIRADWAFFKESLRLPSWQGNWCCWLCTAGGADLRSVGMAAAWRSARLSHQQCADRITARGLKLSPIFSIPGVTVHSCLPDWLHTADLGISSDALGSTMWVVLEKKMPGASRNDRLKNLWAHMRAYYAEHQPSSRLDALTVTMIKQDKKYPKLRCKAGEARDLIPWLKALAEEFFDVADPYEGAIIALSRELSSCYSCLYAFDPEKLKQSARRFAALYVQLERYHPDDWRVKPKLHLFLELCEFVAPLRGSPTLFWTYRDEDAGGECAHMANRRGGPHTAKAVASSLLSRFIARNRAPTA